MEKLFPIPNFRTTCALVFTTVAGILISKPYDANAAFMQPNTWQNEYESTHNFNSKSDTSIHETNFHVKTLLLGPVSLYFELGNHLTQYTNDLGKIDVDRTSHIHLGPGIEINLYHNILTADAEYRFRNYYGPDASSAERDIGSMEFYSKIKFRDSIQTSLPLIEFQSDLVFTTLKLGSTQFDSKIIGSLAFIKSKYNRVDAVISPELRWQIGQDGTTLPRTYLVPGARYVLTLGSTFNFDLSAGYELSLFEDASGPRATAKLTGIF